MKYLLIALFLIPNLSFASNLENVCKVQVEQVFTNKWPVAVASVAKELNWYESTLVAYDGISVQASVTNDPVLKDTFFIVRFKRSRDPFSHVDMIKGSKKSALIISRVLVGTSGQNLHYKIICGNQK